MLLAIDSGNTNVTFGVYKSGALVTHWRISTEHGRTADEYGSLLRNLFSLSQMSFPQIRGVVLASVVPQTTRDLTMLSTDYFHVEPMVVSPALDLGMTIAYQPPEDVGADRLVDAVAALHKYGPAPIIVVDLGTATTFNAIGSGNVYLGGAICPGVGLSWDALLSRAALLHRVELKNVDSAIGSSTNGALQSGMLFGLVSLVDGMVARLRRELEAPACAVIATGGNMITLLAERSSTITVCDDLLTLDGLALVYERNKARVV